MSNITSVPAPFTVGDLNTAIDPVEPRVRDLDLAARLGFDRPRKIRDLIDRHRRQLEHFGSLPQVGADIDGGNGAVHHVQEYWLNEGQAVLLAIRSNAPRAAEVQIAVVKVYLEWRHGANAALRQALLTARPRWAHLRRYVALGLSQREMAKLLDCSDRQIGRDLVAMEAAGLLSGECAS